jgi:hypothetical protein
MGGHISISSLAPGECASACVYALAGGVERFITDGSKVGVHQNSINYGNVYNGSVITVGDLDQSFAESQALIGLAISYFLDMGIDPGIVPMMVSKVPEEIRWLSSSELASTKISYNSKAFGDWAIEPYKSGLVAFTKAADGSRQLTLFCSANRMQFKLTARGGAYGTNLVPSTSQIKEIEIAGMLITAPNFKISQEKDGMVVVGDWDGTEVKPEERSIFSLGEITEAERDLFSMYDFNIRGFQQSLRLARRNCVS